MSWKDAKEVNSSVRFLVAMSLSSCLYVLLHFYLFYQYLNRLLYLDKQLLMTTLNQS